MGSSGRHSTWNGGFIGTLTYPDDDGNINNRNKTLWTIADGGVSYPETKYFDLYQYEQTAERYERRILGDATGEMGPFGAKDYGSGSRIIGSWYADDAWFIVKWSPWFARGGRSIWGNESGIFAFTNTPGGDAEDRTFRVVLSP